MLYLNYIKWNLKRLKKIMIDSHCHLDHEPLLSNLDEVINECSKSNINIINSGTSIRPGVVIGLIEDPDGNLIELMQAD